MTNRSDRGGVKVTNHRAEAAEAEVARLTTLLEQRTAALTRTIDAKNTAEARVARVETLHVRDHKSGTCIECHQGWPCDTRIVIDGGQP